MQVRVVGRPDPSFGLVDGELMPDSSLRPGADVPAHGVGTLASARRDGDDWRIARDPLGLNKLFWARDAPGSVVLAPRPHLLRAEGLSFDAVHAVPRGAVIDIGPDGVRHALMTVPPHQEDAGRPLDEIAADIRHALDGYLAAVASAAPDATAVVCCSGGLDSSGILALANRHFGRVLGVSFDFRRPDARPSEDRVIARRLCDDLGVELLETDVDRSGLLEHLDVVLLEGADWRDFNVHAALVNAVLAESIAGAAGASPLVLTGDLANEFLADYHEERYRGETYYRLPRLGPSALRRWLVAGLDSTHRELGVFGAWGLPVVQPYAAATQHYLSLPGSFLARDDAKQQLCREVFRDLLPGYVLTRQKTRAQVGDPDIGGGVLAACIDQGIDQASLRHRFAELHKLDRLADLDHFIRAGRYRSAVPEENA
ncbi:asparagine synthase-related protein [Pseudonocardia sp. NPDC046786]|uniref:asparagine synthase C-terminal domain-containing protein n=1 Tax=Pseudonocardia sp. NPDC046786 TaxID=3155471 RepID=UPI0033F233A6